MEAFDKIIGYENVKLELYRLADMMNNYEKYRELGAKTTRGLLFEGEPGVGKTLMANCLIEASGRKAFTIRKNLPNGDFIKHIKSTFEEAKKNVPSIVFLDDVDKYANDDQNHKNSNAFVTIQTCIDDCKDDEVFVVATANESECFPDSLLRPGRFDKVISLYAPEYEDAEKICEHFLKDKKVASDVDYKAVSSLLDGGSTARLETIINEAAVYAAYDNRKEITMNDIVTSFLRDMYSTPEKSKHENSKYLRDVAIHEAGHIVVSEVLEPGSISIASIKKYDEDTGGFVKYNQEKDYWLTLSYSLNKVIKLLAGKAALEVVTGKIDVGSIDDISRSSRIPERLVGINCVYGFEYLEAKIQENEPEEMVAKRLKLVHSELDRYYQKAKDILIANRSLLDKVTDALMEKKTLTYLDIKELVNDNNEKSKVTN